MTTVSWYQTHSGATDLLTFRVSDASWSLPQCTSQMVLLDAVVGLLSEFSAGLGFVGHSKVF